MRSATVGRLVGVVGVAFCVVGVLIAVFSSHGFATESSKIAEDKAETGSQLPGQYVHVALYTFKSDLPEGTVADFVDEAEECFGQVPGIRSFRVGVPAGKKTPKAWMVQPNGDYHVGAVLCFDGYHGLAKYGNHPKHNELKQKYAKFFDKIAVYDFQGGQ